MINSKSKDLTPFLLYDPFSPIDIMRISGALPFADVMVVDGPKAADIRELGLDSKYNTAVYSGKLKEINQLRNHLSTINNG